MFLKLSPVLFTGLFTLVKKKNQIYPIKICLLSRMSDFNLSAKIITADKLSSVWCAVLEAAKTCRTTVRLINGWSLQTKDEVRNE